MDWFDCALQPYSILPVRNGNDHVVELRAGEIHFQRSCIVAGADQYIMRFDVYGIEQRYHIVRQSFTIAIARFINHGGFERLETTNAQLYTYITGFVLEVFIEHLYLFFIGL